MILIVMCTVMFCFHFCSVLFNLKLTYDHICLNLTSTMNVRLAAQVLSSSVGKDMLEYSGPECSETANFILKMEKIFYCLNVQSLHEGIRKRNNKVLPYRDINDERFTFLKEFLIT